MKREHDFSRILPVLVFMMIFHNGSLSGQALGGRPGPIYMRTPKTIKFMHIAKTPDRLFIDDSTYFLMDRSPLEQFPGYKKLYDDKVNRYGNVFVVGGIPPDGTTSYKIVWYLNDGMLYLSDIHLNDSSDKIEDIFPDNEQYKRMEELTGVKFDTIYENHTRYMYKEYKDDRSVRNKLFNPFGAMPATWFSGTIVVKRALRLHQKETEWEWNKDPCRELIFKDGTLISNRIKEGMY